MELKHGDTVRLKYGTRRLMIVEDAELYEDDVICFWYDESDHVHKAVFSKFDVEKVINEHNELN